MSNSKKFIKQHKKEVIVGLGSIIVIGASVYFGFQYSNKLKKLKIDNDTLMSACSEGLFDEAIATVTRKLNTVTDRIAVMTEKLLECPNDNDLIKSLDMYNKKFDILSDRQNKFMTAKELYEISCDI